jgi:N-acetylglucosaminyldiphosphoundecaprenol N-acetyl-beta-D-mannosaminyltransferase
MNNGVREVEVATLRVADLTRGELRSLASECSRGHPRIWIALHVGSLREAVAPSYSAAVNSADVRYADGVSIVALARLAGAKRIARYPTTDLGVDLLEIVAEVTGRPVRISLLGGPEGLAEKAAKRLETNGKSVCVSVHNGYSDAWHRTLQEIRTSHPDVLFVGLGVPFEHLFVTERRSELPPCLVVTCGGWFGFLAGHEVRAPVWMQKWGLEWVFRLLQQPKRLFRRYVVGSLFFAKQAAFIIAHRMRAARWP